MLDSTLKPSIEVRLSPYAAAEALRTDALRGLTARQKWLPPKWFYDARGSDIARRSDARTLVELGSGSSTKTRLLLSALRAHGTLHDFVPLDVSVAALTAAVEAIAEDYPGLVIRGIVGDFTDHLGTLPDSRPRMVAFLGGTIGNLLPTERATFLTSVRDALVPGEWLLLGTDLVKDPGTLVRAYDDVAGVTADFNRNVLRVLNRKLDADFEVDAFDHLAVWDADQEWIEMRLVAQRAMEVKVPGIDRVIHFAIGEALRTEISAKFTRPRVEAELAAAGFTLDSWWTDSEGRFALSLAQAV